MVNFDLTLLSPFEFECISRDLLQKRLGVLIESFAEGRDGGIDLRYAENPGKTLIVQAKRYKDWNSLKSVLKKEAEKVGKLNPQQYILTTSVSMTPPRKDEIMKILSPYISKPADIFGAEDMNNLLAQFSEIQRNYPCLWLGSMDILEEILHKDVRNWSDFTLEGLKNDLRTYVNNPSFSEATKILREHRFVIISGIPGIGKTTLAKMLVYTGLSHNYDEFVCITDNLDDAVKLFDKGKRQIFFFDDFLGANAFSVTERNFDAKLLSLIDAIKRDGNKMLILTTREYILSQATGICEKLDQSNLDIAKCTIELSKYTKSIRAEILYNHLAVSELPREYILELLKERSYLRIINHKNFNPRVIEAYIDKGFWKRCRPEDFVPTFIANLDNPAYVWKHAFENHLSQAAQYALLVLSTMGQRATLRAWRKAFEYFCCVNSEMLDFRLSDKVWRYAVRTLENCFVTTKLADGHFDDGDEIVAMLHNPSIRDFIIHYLSESPQTVRMLISAVLFLEQIVKLFSDKVADPGKDVAKQFVSLTEADHSYAECVVDIMRSGEFHTGEYVPRWLRYRDDKVPKAEALAKIAASFPELIKSNPGLLSDIIAPEVFVSDDASVFHKIRLLAASNWDMTTPGYDQMLDHVESGIHSLISCEEYLDYLEGKGLTERLKSEALSSAVKEAITYDIESYVDSSHDLEFRTARYISMIEKAGTVDNVEEIQQMIDEKSKEFENWEVPEDAPVTPEFNVSAGSEVYSDERIYEMMTALLQES